MHSAVHCSEVFFKRDSICGARLFVFLLGGGFKNQWHLEAALKRGQFFDRRWCMGIKARCCDGGMQRHMDALREIERRLDVLAPYMGRYGQRQPVQPSANAFHDRLESVRVWASARGCHCRYIDGPGWILTNRLLDEARVLCDESPGGWMCVYIVKRKGILDNSDLSARVRSCADLEAFFTRYGFTIQR